MHVMMKNDDCLILYKEVNDGHPTGKHQNQTIIQGGGHDVLNFRLHLSFFFFFSLLRSLFFHETLFLYLNKMQTQFNARGNGWRGSNPSRQLDGLSQPLTRSLESMDEKELKAQYEKTNTMLNNP